MWFILSRLITQMAEYSMVQECVDRYEARDRADGGLDIQMVVPPRFRDLWLVKLSELRASDDEIKRYEPAPSD